MLCTLRDEDDVPAVMFHIPLAHLVFGFRILVERRHAILDALVVDIENCSKIGFARVTNA